MMNVYRHYKGGLYRILHLARVEATDETLVIYQPHQGGTIWARPYDDFFSRVEVSGEMIPRFSLIEVAA